MTTNKLGSLIGAIGLWGSIAVAVFVFLPLLCVRMVYDGVRTTWTLLSIYDSSYVKSRGLK